MKVRINFLDYDIEIGKDFIFSLECENKVYFYRIVSLFNRLSKGELDESIQIYNDEKEVNCSNKIEIFVDYFNIDFSDKKYQSKMIELLSRTISQDSIYRINNQLKKIQKEIEINLGNLELPVVLTKELDTDFLFKVLKLSLQTEDNILNKLLLIIDIEKTFHCNYFLIFVNLKQYLSEVELNEFYKYALYNQINIILLESKSYGTTNHYEKKLIIDENLDEFMLK